MLVTMRNYNCTYMYYNTCTFYMYMYMHVKPLYCGHFGAASTNCLIGLKGDHNYEWCFFTRQLTYWTGKLPMDHSSAILLASSPGHSHLFNVARRKAGRPGTRSHVRDV